jgi:hypothetical protein
MNIRPAIHRGLVLLGQGVFSENRPFDQVDVPRQKGSDIPHGFFVARWTDSMGDPILSGSSADFPIAPGTLDDKHTVPSFFLFHRLFRQLYVVVIQKIDTRYC